MQNVMAMEDAMAQLHLETPQDPYLERMVRRCWHDSPTIRYAAAFKLGNLVVAKKEAQVIRAYINGPMLLINDSNDEVKALVIKQIEDMIFKRLANGTEDQLPWMFINEMGNMFKTHLLTKVCNRLAESDDSVINVGLVETLRNLLGTSDDYQDYLIMTLLNCMAPCVIPPDVTFVVNYYYKEADQPLIRSPFMSGALELLINWAHLLPKSHQKTLRDHVIKRLANRQMDGNCHNDTSYRTFASRLAYQIDPDDLKWASQLMAESSRAAIKSRDLMEASRAAEYALVAPDMASDELVDMFVDLIFSPPRDWRLDQHYLSMTSAVNISTRNRAAAEKIAPALAFRLLDKDSPVQATVHVICSLTNICIRFGITSDYIRMNVYKCLYNKPPQLRRAAAKALGPLLVEGRHFLKQPYYYSMWGLTADSDSYVSKQMLGFMTNHVSDRDILRNIIYAFTYFNKVGCVEALCSKDRQKVYETMYKKLTLIQKLTVLVELARLFSRAAYMAKKSPLPPEEAAIVLDGIRFYMRVQERRRTVPYEYSELQELEEQGPLIRRLDRNLALLLIPAVRRLTKYMTQRGDYMAPLMKLFLQVATDELQPLLSGRRGH